MASDTREGDIAAVEACEKDGLSSPEQGDSALAEALANGACGATTSEGEALSVLDPPGSDSAVAQEGADLQSDAAEGNENKTGASSLTEEVAPKCRSVAQVKPRSRFPLARKLRKIVSSKTKMNMKADKNTLAEKTIVREDSMEVFRAEPAPEPECADPEPDSTTTDRRQPEADSNNQVEELEEDAEGQEIIPLLLEDPYSVAIDPYMNDFIQTESVGLTVYSTEGPESDGGNMAIAASEEIPDELEADGSKPNHQPPPLKRRRGKSDVVVAAQRQLNTNHLLPPTDDKKKCLTNSPSCEEPRRDAAELRREVAAEIAKENLHDALDEIHSERNGHASALRGALLDFEERALRALGRVRDLQLRTEADDLLDDVVCGQGEEITASDNLYIKGLPPNITDAKLQKVFSAYGSVVQTRVLDSEGYAGDSIALVRMGSIKEAQWLVDNLDGATPKGLQQSVTVRFAAPRRNRVQQPMKPVATRRSHEDTNLHDRPRSLSRPLPRRKPFAMIRRRLAPVTRRSPGAVRLRDVRDASEQVSPDPASRSFSSREEPTGATSRPLMRRRRISGAEVVARQSSRHDEGSPPSPLVRRGHAQSSEACLSRSPPRRRASSAGEALARREVVEPLPRRRRRDVAELEGAGRQERSRSPLQWQEASRDSRLSTGRAHLQDYEDERPRSERERGSRAVLPHRSGAETLRLVGGDRDASRAVEVISSRSAAREEALRQRPSEGSRSELRKNEYLGRMKSFSAQTGYGFIESERIKEKYGGDVFVHHSQIDPKEIHINDEVIFEVVFNDERKPQARAIRLRSKPQASSSSSRPPLPRAEEQSGGRASRGHRAQGSAMSLSDDDVLASVDHRSRERLARNAQELLEPCSRRRRSEALPRSSEEYMDSSSRRHRSHASEAISRNSEEFVEQRSRRTRSYALEDPLSDDELPEPRRRRQRSFAHESDEPIVDYGVRHRRSHDTSPLPLRSEDFSEVYERHRGRKLQAAVESAAAAASKSGHVDADLRNRVEALASRLNDVPHERSTRRRTSREM